MRGVCDVIVPGALVEVTLERYMHVIARQTYARDIVSMVGIVVGAPNKENSLVQKVLWCDGRVDNIDRNKINALVEPHV